METTTQDLRYPTGKYTPVPYSPEQHQAWLNDIKFLPQLLENAILNLDEKQLETPYRDGGWTIKQVVHHVGDSHMNAIIRFKLGLTENNPAIKPYDEAAWAELNDVKELPINITLTMLHAIHARWYAALYKIDAETLQQRTVFHPEHQKEMTLWYLLGMYAWHGKHHVAHITSLRDRNHW
ncbi:YfiT family bacillithiol transferase [Flavihumibacter petaseus]|uniref:Putative hydrolase n=1 Tax=Flavihumibacter petaseus NBRC 106054 TaxID=1220578 RepID=A0A0E9N541_9BACT|nr:putative metal-dependent hydrolase [Flavihumibacter petaseus]GAO44465.1 putative hydrolase [Flavihumibacter petaseus NBRC 106054]